MATQILVTDTILHYLRFILNYLNCVRIRKEGLDYGQMLNRLFLALLESLAQSTGYYFSTKFVYFFSECVKNSSVSCLDVCLSFPFETICILSLGFDLIFRFLGTFIL